MKKIYVETFGYKPHSLYQTLFNNAPKGYEFIVPREKIHHNKLGKFKILKLANSIMKKTRNPIIKKMNKMKSKNPSCDFVYSIGNLVSYNKPYIVDFENVLSFMGWDPYLFKKNKKLLEKEFSKEKCKFLTTWDKQGAQSILKNLNCEKFKHKIKIVPIAIENKKIIKKHFRNGKIRFLFLSSINLPEDFYMKGGKEALEIFKRLKKRGYKNINLNITGTIPKKFKNYEKISGLNVLGMLSKQKLDELMLTSDILLSPIHNTPGLAFLDAMNYELAIITSDVLGNSERIQHGENGILVPASKKVPYSKNNLPNARQLDYNRAIKKWDEEYIEKFVKSCENLINNRKDIEKMGKAGKKKIENGIFSIKARNAKLKKLFDKF